MKAHSNSIIIKNKVTAKKKTALDISPNNSAYPTFCSIYSQILWNNVDDRKSKGGFVILLLKKSANQNA